MNSLTAVATVVPRTDSARMALSAVVKGRIQKPLRIMLFGVEGVGKSTFAAGAPVPIFLGAEDGTNELDVSRFPEPRSWLDALEAVNALTDTDHAYKTFVLDTCDWLEPHVWAQVCSSKRDKRGQPFADIEDIGYGKGYAAALDVWRVLLAALERMRAKRGMTVILIAHSWIKAFKNPEGDDYDRHEMKLHPKAGALLREWCDTVLFATHQTYTHESNGRSKGISDGARVIHTQRTAAFDAKNRQSLPPTLPLDWPAFADAVAAHEPADPTKLRARIAALLEQCTDAAIKARVTTALGRVGDDAAELARIENHLAATVSIKEGTA